VCAWAAGGGREVETRARFGPALRRPGEGACHSDDKAVQNG
jgi:hypothetical protein